MAGGIDAIQADKVTLKSGRSTTFRVATCKDGDRETVQANARLIAAAPDLLEALIGVRHIAEDFISDWAADTQEGGKGDPSEVARWHNVLSAIAKATGAA